MKTNQGFVAKIVLIVIALITIKYYFHFDIIEWIKSDSGQNIFGPVIHYTKAFYYFLDNLVKGWVNK